jgi:phosphoribosylformimino-5-aminoimidazole carboxamide ribotide isomerase
MQIIPVIDLLDRIVVRGVGGRRSEYQPVVSQLADSSSPADIASAFARLALTTIYVADLDAISGKSPLTDCYQQIADAGASLWIDAGIHCVAQAKSIRKWASGIVVGSETLADLSQLAELNQVFQDRIIFSLDLKQGRVLTRNEDWRSLDAFEVAGQVLRSGIRKLIVLDLARVGECRGVGTEPLCQKIRDYDSNVMLISGGGVRGAEDLASLQAAGCNAALVASALHDRRIVVPPDRSLH